MSQPQQQQHPPASLYDHQPATQPTDLPSSATQQDPRLTHSDSLQHQHLNYNAAPSPLQAHNSTDGSAVPVSTAAFSNESPGWGDTQIVGTPANLDSHPDNRRAATTSNGSDVIGEQHTGVGGGKPNVQIPNVTGTQGSPYVHTSAVQGAPGKTPMDNFADAGVGGGNPYVQTPNPTRTQGSPHIHTNAVQGPPGKSPMDNFTDTLNKWGKEAENMTGNVITHLKTGPSMADTAWGRLSLGTKMLTEGGLANVFKQTFPSSPDEQLLKSYACYLSTSTGPVPGTLYTSTQKLAFCSDRPLSSTSSSGEQSWNYYKVILPLVKVQAVIPDGNKNKPTEKYIQVTTIDQHEFWFMGFVNYEKGLTNMQEAVKNRGYKSEGGYLS